MILALRTDKPEAELYLMQSDGAIVDSVVWHAHRQLSDTLLIKIDALLAKKKLVQREIDGLISYQGPGSFTGLRIGMTVANTVAYVLGVPHVGAQSDSWLESGVKQLTNTSTKNPIVTPEYGADANVTRPRK